MDTTATELRKDKRDRRIVVVTGSLYRGILTIESEDRETVFPKPKKGQKVQLLDPAGEEVLAPSQGYRVTYRRSTCIRAQK